MHRGHVHIAGFIASFIVTFATPLSLAFATLGGMLNTTITAYDYSRKDYDLGYVGSPLIIDSFLFSDQMAPQPFVDIFEVRNSDDITQFIAWQSGTLLRDREQVASVSWIPEKPGLYKFRTYAISSFENPVSVQRLEQMVLNVVEVDPGNRAYMLFHDGTDYVIEYSMEYGDIYSVTADRELTTIKMLVGQVTNETDFTFKVPKTLLAELLRCGGEEPASIDHLPEPIGFADSIPISFTILDWGAESATLKARLEAGTEEVELVAGGCVP